MKIMAARDKSEDSGLESAVTDNTENRFAVDLVFVKILLPALRNYVLEKLGTFYDENPILKKPGGYRELETDPVKKNVDLIHPVVMYANQDLLPNVHEFAKLYFEKPYFEDLLSCGDVRVFLVLVTKAGCFNGVQANVAYKLKNQRDTLAHREIISDKMKLEVFENVEILLQTIPNNHDVLQAIETARVGGVRSFLRPIPKLNAKSMKGQRKSNEGNKLCTKQPNRKTKSEQKPFYQNSHLMTAFSINLVCLLLSIANIATGDTPTVGQIKEIEQLENGKEHEQNVTGKENDKSLEVEEDHEENMKTNEEIKCPDKSDHNQSNHKASNTWITTVTKRRNSQEKEPKKTSTLIKPDGKLSPKRNGIFSAISAGYFFNCWDPSPDPRFHPDTQLRIGPIPGDDESAVKTTEHTWEFDVEVEPGSRLSYPDPGRPWSQAGRP